MKQFCRLFVILFFNSAIFSMEPAIVPRAEILIATAQDPHNFFSNVDITQDFMLDGKKYNITKWPDWPSSQISYIGVARKEIKDDVENYKLYLMPTQKNRVAIFNQLLAYMELHPDSVEGVKIYIEPYDDQDGIKDKLPIIVVYPSNRVTAQETLNKLYFMLQNEPAINKSPRFSRKINDLIYYAQGNASIKERARPGESFEDITIYPKRYYPKDAQQMPHYSHLHENLKEGDIFKYHLAHPDAQEEERLQKIKNSWYKEHKLETMVKKPARQGYLSPKSRRSRK